MLHISIPDEAYYFEGKKDDGKKVIINSVGGALVNEPGVVVVGPYVYPYVHKVEIKTKSRNPMAQKRHKNEDRISQPLWLVKVEKLGRCLSFVASELQFPKKK